ncbi:TPA: helix-turn-helix transcriptional regulator [Pasteurella multocida]|uniref:helix-turn-helix transcriptional regulator n=1 Tax=Pasteurella multocida TaxID=747 RepID=UPI0009F1E1AA|nr:AlpA family phage regulatory protein [Pasteurella multocida]QDA13769.1 AlpA family phage regulatory protein [Pasteurella multocida subsp. multocida]MCL7818571.1 AlpA family phage regulatory protein [Pasteurella multocida]MDY0488815.1 AlpA family phage regulatory protein [Pasteurella multocida]MDY0595348.1 AlpA family phage regulatory protein [Pasteurella multocida]MDY0664736.1 AlpA family phage regulatory protein [Pasteurella multocida]
MNELNKKERFISLEEVINRTSLKKTAIYSQIQKGLFPRPISLGIHRTAWLESEIDNWIAIKIQQNRKE